jgi:antitoxin (DNA-binding transcriptional repressor) of toxin-antitoxin stability system
MEKVNISQLKKSLSSVLEMVRGGRVFIVYDRHTPVAQLSAFPAEPSVEGETREEAQSARLRGLERSGVIVRGTGESIPDILTDPPQIHEDVPEQNTALLNILLEEREDRL